MLQCRLGLRCILDLPVGYVDGRMASWLADGLIYVGEELGEVGFCGFRCGVVTAVAGATDKALLGAFGGP